MLIMGILAILVKFSMEDMLHMINMEGNLAISIMEAMLDILNMEDMLDMVIREGNLAMPMEPMVEKEKVT